MAPPIATAGIVISTSINVTHNAVNKLWSSSVQRESNKASEIRQWSLQQHILPKGKADEKELQYQYQYIKTPLMEFIRLACISETRGNSHVLYASSSVGKTTACRAIMEFEAKGKNIQALMITGAQKHLPYITHLAKVLKVEKEEDVLVDLIDGMRTVPPKPASILILDEMNDAGVENCNLLLVDALMRFIYDKRQGIHLIVVTQNQDVADDLCRLNKWQKIAPLNGLTNPTRLQVQGKKAEIPGKDKDISWDPKAVEWSLEDLTKFIDNQFRGHGFEKGGADSEKKDIITWLELGMTPTAAEQLAEILLDEERKKKKIQEAGGKVDDDPFASFL